VGARRGNDAARAGSLDESSPQVKVLLLSSRFPWPAYTGDRLRATIWLAALQRDADVTLIAPNGPVPADAPRFRFIPAARSALSAMQGAMRVLRGAPVQSLLAAPYDWRSAIQRAGDFDAAIVLLSRLDPSVRELLPARVCVLDAIDSLQQSMLERAREGSPLTRWFWRAEARRVARAEERAVRAYDRVVVVSADEADELHAVAIPNGVDVAAPGVEPRTYDFGFWGRLAYFANADAVAWLLDEIWPAIRAQRPNATLLIAGADAPARILSAHARDGITVQSPVDDMRAVARRIRVALFPMRYGTGQSNKVLEAAEAGCALVATAQAMRGFAPLAKHASIANDVDGLVRAALNPSANGALRTIVETTYARERTLEQLASLVLGRKAAA
jgi:polysaccharide biosynthesis protein PslH